MSEAEKLADQIMKARQIRLELSIKSSPLYLAAADIVLDRLRALAVPAEIREE